MVEPRDDRRDKCSHQHHQYAERDVNPKQRADLLDINLFLLNRRHRQSHVFEHRHEAGDYGDHTD